MDWNEAKRSAIAEAFCRLLGKKPFKSISVSDVCCEMDMSRSSFYRYFRDIDEVGEWYWNRVLRAVHLEVGKTYGLHECYRRSFETLVAMQGGMKLGGALRPYGNGATWAEIQVADIFAERICTSRGAPLSDEEHTALEYMSCANRSITSMWFIRGMKESPETMADILLAIAPQFVVDALGNAQADTGED